MSDSNYQRYIQTAYSEVNKAEYNTNDYSHVYSTDYNKPLSIQQEADIEYEKVCYYLAVTSNNRDISTHPNPNHYVVNLDKEYKNIHSIELVQAIVPDKNNVTDEPYLLLKIDEVENVMDSVDRPLSESFAVLELAPPTSPGTFIQMDKRIYEHTIKIYKTPKASLSKMTISINNYQGLPFNFGNDTSPTFQKELQNTFIFKFICLEKQRKQLGQRNVF